MKNLFCDCVFERRFSTSPSCPNIILAYFLLFVNDFRHSIKKYFNDFRFLISQIAPRRNIKKVKLKILPFFKKFFHFFIDKWKSWCYNIFTILINCILHITGVKRRQTNGS
jgi:hypothetical protein